MLEQMKSGDMGMNEDGNADEKQIIQQESIKLTKNSKGYGWEIKIFPKEMNDEQWLARLKEIDNQLLREYGSVE